MPELPPESPIYEQAHQTIGGYMRQQRLLQGLTQKQVADALFMSKSAYQKYENEERNPTVPVIRQWCDALDLRYDKRRRVMSIVMGELAPWAVGSPEAITPDALEFIDSMPYPAYLHRVPQYDVLAANAAANEMCPFLDPALGTPERPINVIVQMMTDPRAEKILVNWEPIVHRMIYGLREFSAGVVPDTEVAAVYEACRSHPRFEYMWNNPMDPAIFDDDHVVMLDPAGRETNWRMRSLQSLHPWCDYEIFLLTPRSMRER
ncbi:MULTISPECIES: helix-turn-helix domain-containing protein [unclassified Nocardia]|uniref:helix-turn-helix domain-containing protein n=1 Tax=unclassified Nocardia TaxID=2637762 RepID=UPI0024A9BA73|nr:MULTISPECIES: helix-turn-helix domain-containing protein [unclassified Nocardia]